MLTISWLIIGVLLGIAAAQKRGFSVLAGALGGLLLGPLAVLLFLVSGVARSDRTRKCPYCAELVKAEAIVCKHCGRDLVVETAPPPTAGSRTDRALRNTFLVIGALVVLGALAQVLMSRSSPPRPRSASTTGATAGEHLVNTMSDTIAAMTEPRRADALARLLADEPCGSVSRTFYQGIDRTSGSAFWNVRCANGRSYAVSIAADAQGSARTLDCKVLKAVAGTDCFTKFPETPR